MRLTPLEIYFRRLLDEADQFEIAPYCLSVELLLYIYFHNAERVPPFKTISQVCHIFKTQTATKIQIPSQVE